MLSIDHHHIASVFHLCSHTVILVLYYTLYYIIAIVFVSILLIMGVTQQKQRRTKKLLDEKLSLSQPSRDLLEQLAVTCASKPSPDNTFQYAFALSKSNDENELKYAVDILDGLVHEGYEHQMDCMVGSATALYLLGDYTRARSRCEAILRSRPDSRNTKELHLACIEGEEERKEQLLKKGVIESTIGMAAIGVAIGVAGMLLKKK